MRHPLMIMMTMARALSQWVIRTVKEWTITFETRCRRPAVMSVIVASQRALFVDRHEAGGFERRLASGDFRNVMKGCASKAGSRAFATMYSIGGSPVAGSAAASGKPARASLA